jgi:UDP-N-acetylglucosamine--N-acetylmuramyl-(pentapeptide) pyrophosphoryl-undecaprenol N-acetylglucosamine transferase
MKVLLTGGGTGGHITPILAVAHELKHLDSKIDLVYVGERNGKFASILEGNSDIGKTRKIFAGKFRRYHGESWLRRLIDVKTIALNFRDAGYFIIGTIQSFFLVRIEKPDVIFLKGGFVGVPIGLAGALWRVPMVTHDSDTVPGLANRLVSRWAKIHATAMPASFYKYPIQNTRQVGVLVAKEYVEVTPKLISDYRNKLDIPKDAKVLMITGGSSGAERINMKIAEIAPKLLENYKNLYIIHQTGNSKEGVYSNFTHQRLRVFGLIKDMYTCSGAADLIITRAGANTLAEFGVQGRACIVIPSPFLTGGHQLKNAQYLDDSKAALVIQEDNLDKIYDSIKSLMNDKSLRSSYADKLHSITITDATQRLANILIGVALKKDV